MRYLVIIACLMFSGVLAAGEAVQIEPYMGRGLGEDGKTETRTAVRTFKPASGKGPAIVLVGVAHLGDASYYTEIQSRLNACDLVLYEGVGRPEFMVESAAETADPKGWAESALRYLSDIVVWYRDEIGSLPDSFRKLRLAVRLHNPKELAWLDRINAGPKGWTIQLTRNDNSCTLRYVLKNDDNTLSNVAGMDAVVTMTTRDSTADSLQKQLAEALGLQFQMDGIDYSSPKFVNSDLTISQLRARMRGETAPEPAEPETHAGEVEHVHSTLPHPDDNELETLVKRLQGDDPAIKLAMTMAKGFLTQSEQGRELVKWILGEALVNAESLMDGSSKRSKELLMGSADLMKVLIQDRNAVVMQDLRRNLKEKPALKSIAIFYGAAHMSDFHSRLVNELGFEVTGTEWLTVFSADREKAGITIDQANEIRRTIREQLK